MEFLRLTLFFALVLLFDRARAGWDFSFDGGPMTNIDLGRFPELQVHERSKRQARPNMMVQNRGRPAPGLPNLPEHKEGNQIITLSLPNCQEDGLVMRQGLDFIYFVKCQRNYQYGGFYRVVYICPKHIRQVTHVSQCVPPPDCSACEGGIENEEFNGLV